MKIRLVKGLPYVSAQIQHGRKILKLKNILLDTGSGGSLFSADILAKLGLKLEPNDYIHRIKGVGGFEWVFSKRIDRLTVGDLSLARFEVEVGTLDYGLPLDAIVGFDFLRKTKALVDFSRMELRSAI